MKNPNGYGSVEKLSGTRRKPFRVRITKGWDIDIANGTTKQERVTLGYYATRKEAMLALADYNNSPYQATNYTIRQIYDKWSAEHYKEIAPSSVKGYTAAWKVLEPIANNKIKDIRLDPLQALLDNSGKNTPTLRNVRALLSQIIAYSIKHDYISADKAKLTSYLNIKKAGNPNQISRTPFSAGEIETLWNHTDEPTVQITLMLIYCGARISELLELKKEDVFLDEHYFNITKSKTKAGIRSVPINDKTYQFFVRFYQQSQEYLLENNGQPWKYRNFYDSQWKQTMERHNMEHRPHDTRHTCISMLTEAGVDERSIKKIVGHSGNTVTQIVYTHLEVQHLLTEINKI